MFIHLELVFLRVKCKNNENKRNELCSICRGREKEKKSLSWRPKEVARFYPLCVRVVICVLAVPVTVPFLLSLWLPGKLNKVVTQLPTPATITIHTYTYQHRIATAFVMSEMIKCFLLFCKHTARCCISDTMFPIIFLPSIWSWALFIMHVGGQRVFFSSLPCPDRRWGPPNHLSIGYRELFPRGVKWPQRKAGHLPPNNDNAGSVFPTFHTCSWCSLKKIQRKFIFIVKGRSLHLRKGTHYPHVTWAHVILRVQLGC